MFTTFKDPNKIDENSPLYQSMAAEKQNKTDQWQSILNDELGGLSKDFGMPKSFEAAGKPKEKSSGSSASPLAALGDALGTPVRTTPGVVGSGMYFNGQNIITPNTATPVADVLANDLSRSQQANPTDYNAFADMLLGSDFYMQELASRGFTPETFTQSVLDAFRQKDGLGIPREQGEYEAANLFAKEFLFSDAEAVARLKSTDPALFEKVSGWAQSLEKRLRGTDFAAAGSAIARLYSVAPASGQGYNEEEQKQLARAFETADRIISLTPAALSGSGEGRPPVYDFTKTPEENKALREKYDDWWKNATPFERLNQIKSGVEWTDRKPLPYARIDPLSDFGREAMQKQQAEWEAGPFAGLSDLEAAIKLLEMDESEFFQLPESVQETALINYILQVKQSENYWTNFSANFSDSEKVNAFANAFVNEYILGGAVDKLMRLFNGGPTDRQLQADFLALRYPYQTGAGKVAAWFVPGLNTAAAGKLEALFTPLAGKVSDKMMRKLSGLWNMSPEALAQSKWRSALLKGGEKALTRGLASGAADLTLGTAQSLISGSSLSDALRDGIRSGQWGLYGGVAAGAVAGAIEGFRLSELAQAYHKAGGDFMWGDVTNWFRIGPYYDEYLMRGGDAAYGSFDAYLMFERLDDLYGELGGKQVWGSKDDFAEKVFVEADWLSHYAATGKHVGTVTELLQKSSCSSDELFLYLTKTAGEDAAKAFRADGTWPRNVQIPKSSNVLTADGAIDWSQAPKNGFVLNQAGEPMCTAFIPRPGEIIDRYGPPDGRFVCPVIDGKPFSYVQRSLPYLEDPAQYHQYEVIGDFSKLEEYVQNCTDKKLVQQINAYVRKNWKGNYAKITSYYGNIASVNGWGSGGGIQYQLPFSIDWLVSLGLVRLIK